MIFWRNVLPSSSGLWICGLTDKPKDEGCTSLQIFGKKLPDHMAKQTTRSTSSTIRWWKPQNHSFHIVKNMFLYYYIFIVHCVLLMQDWLSMKEYNDKCFHNIWMSISMNIELYYFLKKVMANVNIVWYWILVLIVLTIWLFPQHNVVSEIFISVNRREKFYFKWPKYTRK